MDWRRLLLGIAGAMFLLAAGIAGAVSVGTGADPGAIFVDVILVGGPGAAFIYGAWVLPRARIDPDLFPRVVLWTFGGMVVMLVAAALATLRPGAVIPDPEGIALSLAALGGAGGLAIGLYEARAVTQNRQRLRAREEAADAWRQKEHLEQIQSVIGHDIKSPMSGIYANIDLARDTGDLSHLDDAEEAARRVEDLIEDLGRLTREGVLVEDTEPVPLADLARDVWGSLGTARGRLQVDLEGMTVEADRGRLGRLLDNLFRNAVNHGGPDVVIEVGQLPGEEGFYVQDDGPGFPGAPRQALEVGYTTHEDGTGFGLPIVQRIARSHGWSLNLTEAPEGGARVEVRT